MGSVAFGFYQFTHQRAIIHVIRVYVGFEAERSSRQSYMIETQNSYPTLTQTKISTNNNPYSRFIVGLYYVISAKS